MAFCMLMIRLKQIKKFNQNFDLVKLLELEYHPMRFTYFNSELAVRAFEDTTNKSPGIMYYYDINTFDLNRKSDAASLLTSNCCEIDSTFYMYRSKEVDCFNQNGKFIETIQLEDACILGKLIIFNKTLIMSSFDGKNLSNFNKIYYLCFCSFQITLQFHVFV